MLLLPAHVSSLYLLHRICCTFPLPWLMFTWQYVLAVSVMNAVWCVLSHKRMEYISSCIVGPIRSVSLEEILLLEQHAPSKTKWMWCSAGTFEYCLMWKVIKFLYGASIFINLVDMAKIFIFFHKFRICLMQIWILLKMSL